MSMFSFWSRKGNKSPAAGRTSNILPQSSQPDIDVDTPRPVSRTAYLTSVPQEDHPSPAPPKQVAPEPVVAAVPNPHDASVSEVHAKLLQAEQLSSTARPRTSADPLTDANSPSSPPPEPLFDPATGAQRGFFDPVSAGVSGDSEQHRDEVWAHLARIRELQSEIAVMHMHMEGIGDESGSMDVEVDVDIDVDTVPTQEEEEAAKREKEFMKLPGRFKGRSDNIDAMMAKLDDLSQAVTSFHSLQPPPLSFESTPTSRQNTHSDASGPAGERAMPLTVRTRPNIPPATLFGSRVAPDQNQIAELLHDSPVSAHAALATDTPNKT